MLITNLILAYLAFFVVVILHELGHMGKRIKIVSFLPLPSAASMDSCSRYGGLVMNLLIIFGIYYLNPQMLFLQLIGLTAYLHFVIYCIVGSFNYEPKIPAYLEPFWIFDDIPNKWAIIFVPLGLYIFWIFREFYIPILSKVIHT